MKIRLFQELLASNDPAGNRLSSLGESSSSVNTSNELTSTPSATYTYDNNGNTLAKVTSAGTTTYTWDYENRLTSVTLPGTGGTLAFKYDSLGRRIQKVFTQSSTTTTRNYLYDGNNALADVDQNGNVLARYAMTQNIDEPLEEFRSGATSYYSQDGRWRCLLREGRDWRFRRVRRRVACKRNGRCVQSRRSFCAHRRRM